MKPIPEFLHELKNWRFSPETSPLRRIAEDHRHTNAWFVPESIAFALDSLSAATSFRFPSLDHLREKKVLFIDRSLAPLEGFLPVFQLVEQANRIVYHAPEDNGKLVPELVRLADSAEHFGIFERNASLFDVVVVSGELANDAFWEYISRWPLIKLDAADHQFRLQGDEGSETLREVSFRICQHFGRAQNSIHTLTVPTGYDFTPLRAHLESFRANLDVARYFNHYEYALATMMINRIPYREMPPVLFTADESMTGKTGVVVYREG